MAEIEMKHYFEKESFENEIEKLFYAVMYRQWEIVSLVAQTIRKNGWNWEKLKTEAFRKTDITIEDCFRYNLDYLKSMKNKHTYEKICKILGEEFKKVKNENETSRYDDKRFYKKEKQSVLDVFWNGDQPVLNLKYYEQQTMAARQVMKHRASMVLDEVGTGKTVAGIFTIQQVIQEQINAQKQAAILIICPYNKREDWHSDILRQLGRESVVINQSDHGRVLMKKGYRGGVPKIYISGNIGGEEDDGTQQLKKSFLNYGKDRRDWWDLVVIDECHSCFDNYKEVRAKKVLLLSATPIVVNSNGVRTFRDYEVQMNVILGDWNYIRNEINPIEKEHKNENVSEDDFFVCNFKEHIFENIKINRQIKFVECKRDQRRQKWFEKIYDKKGFFSAIYADQDDQLLAAKASEIDEGRDHHIEKNYKLEKLVEIVYKENKKDSFIIFCETKGAVDLVYERISGYASDDLMVGKLHSGIAEIKNHQTNKDILIFMMREHIRSGKKGVLVITSKSGSTGLNLGEFHAVVHYELPFSSNELEQRFGRIERADELIREDGEKRTIKNKMIFLINEAVEGQLDFVTNRMLYYAVNKINKTIDYMPVRNTVLFHPEYRKRVIKQAQAVFGELSNHFYMENMKKDLKDYFTYAKACDQIQEIVEDIEDDDITNKVKEKSLEETIGILMTEVAQEEIGKHMETIKSLDRTYRKAMEGHTETMRAFGRKLEEYIEYYLWLCNTLSFWGKDYRPEDFFNEIYNKAKTKAIDKAETETEDIAEAEENVQEMKFDFSKEILRTLRKKEEEERYVLMEGCIKKMQGALEQAEPEQEYSGVFYRNKDKQIINCKMENRDE